MTDHSFVVTATDPVVVAAGAVLRDFDGVSPEQDGNPTVHHVDDDRAYVLRRTGLLEIRPAEQALKLIPAAAIVRVRVDYDAVRVDTVTSTSDLNIRFAAAAARAFAGRLTRTTLRP